MLLKPIEYDKYGSSQAVSLIFLTIAYFQNF